MPVRFRINRKGTVKVMLRRNNCNNGHSIPPGSGETIKP